MPKSSMTNVCEVKLLYSYKKNLNYAGKNPAHGLLASTILIK